MRFISTGIAGAFLIEFEGKSDDRGYFCRAFCAREFAAQGLVHQFVQANDSFNHVAGTLRGMHYQVTPRSETKLVRCIRGAIWDCILDLREGSPTFGTHFGAELTSTNQRGMYVPKGLAHGFITIEDETLVSYLVDEYYSGEHERGVRWDDPAFGISWPEQVRVISQKDAAWPNYRGANDSR